VPSFRQGIGLRTGTEALRHLLKQDMFGEQPPEKVLQGIEALANATPRSPSMTQLLDVFEGS
jgi:hypothetical protein